MTTNECRYTFHATKNTHPETTFSADLHIKCPPEKSIEIHVYNTSNHNDAGAATLCTFDIGSQTPEDEITLTNIEGTPDDILAHINLSVNVDRTIQSGTCGEGTETTSVYKGTHTLRATNAAGEFVNTTVS